MFSAGIVAVDSIDNEWTWTGGRYYLQHLVKCVAELQDVESIGLRDVWWNKLPETDPFAEVREILGEPIVVSLPSTILGRIGRKLSRLHHNLEGAKDLFIPYGIDIFFPKPPCENSGIPYVAWLPDFQHLRRPDLMNDRLRDWLKASFQNDVKNAIRIVLSSQDARNDFASMFPHDIDRTHVVPFCSVPDSDWWKIDPFLISSKYGLPERFFIVCNQFTRHKNYLTVLRAMKILDDNAEHDIHVVCTGSIFDYRYEDYIGQIRRYLAEKNLDNRVHILGLLPRAEQIALLRRSIAVLQPSWFEGWSTVIEDAKTLGKLVLASDLPVHHEQLGTSTPYYLALEDAEDWAEAMLSAWYKLEPGPVLDDEIKAQCGLKVKQLECGRAFVEALRLGITCSGP